jgi:hypothetical protein
MKNIMLVLFLLSTQLGFTQRQEQIDARRLDRYLDVDFQFWRSYASQHLEQTQKPLIQVGLSTDDWVQLRCSAKQFPDKVAFYINMLDSNGNEAGAKKVMTDPAFMVFADDKSVHRKVGFAYTDSYGNQEFIKNIFFAEKTDWTKINDQRKNLFLDLLLSVPKEQLADSILTITVQGKNERFFLFDLRKHLYYENDTSWAPTKLTRFLLAQYDKEVAALYYTAKEKEYTVQIDQWGNSAMQSNGVPEKTVTVVDENGVATIQKIVPKSMQTKAIMLYYDRQSDLQKNRLIYTGVTKPIQTDYGAILGDVPVYVSTQAKSRFSATSQFLLNYLIQINQ